MKIGRKSEKECKLAQNGNLSVFGQNCQNKLLEGDIIRYDTNIIYLENK